MKRPEVVITMEEEIDGMELTDLATFKFEEAVQLLEYIKFLEDEIASLKADLRDRE